jgi:transposase
MCRVDDLVARLKVLKPYLIVLEATGGFETVVVAALAAAALPVAGANPAQSRLKWRANPLGEQ